MPPEVVEPGFVVDPGGQLQEENQVVGAEIQSSFRPAKIKAAFRNQQAFGVFATVAAALGAACWEPDGQRRTVVGFRAPDDGFAFG